MLHEMREFAQLVVGLYVTPLHWCGLFGCGCSFKWVNCTWCSRARAVLLWRRYVASDLKRASEDVEERRDPFEFHELLRSVFEVGRRYKIQNPTKMRTTYGKMMHILMDAVQPAMTNEIGANMFTPTQSVHSILRPFGAAGEAFLADADLLLAASPIDHARGIDDCVGAATMSSPLAKGKVGGKSNVELAARELHMREAKQAALQRIKSRHVRKAHEDTTGIPAVVVERCLESIGDALAFISVSTASVEAMIDLLLHFFDPRNDGGGAGNRSLQLRYGSGGEKVAIHLHSLPDVLSLAFVGIHCPVFSHCLSLLRHERIQTVPLPPTAVQVCPANAVALEGNYSQHVQVVEFD